MNLDFQVEGFEDTLTMSVRASAEIRTELHEILGETSKLALEIMQRKVPRGRNPDPYHRSIYSSLREGGIVYRPGAAGGGGYYEIEVGSLDPPEQLDWIMNGTSRYPAPGNMGKIMAIQKLGEGVHFRTKRAGQKPQTEWFTEAYRAANAYLYARLQALNINF